jgi:hypothetical protein
VAWLFIVVAACATPISVLQNVMIVTMLRDHARSWGSASALAQLPAAHRFVLTHMEGLFLAVLVICVYALACSIGLLKRKDWARRGFLGLLAIGIVSGVAALVFQSVFLSEIANRPAASGQPHLRVLFFLMKVLAAVMVLALVVVFGWMIRKLTSPPIKAEFSSSRRLP